MTGDSTRPVLMVVDADVDARTLTVGELERRYGRDYRVVSHESAASALPDLKALRAAGDCVAVVLADQGIGDPGGSELLAQTRALHPAAKRALMIEWGGWSDAGTSEVVLNAMALGHIDYYAIKPAQTPDEQFHRLMSEFIYEWTHSQARHSAEITIVAPQWSQRSHNLRSILSRSGVPYVFLQSGSAEAQNLLAEVGHEAAADADAPIVRMRDGTVILDPSDADLARAFGVRTELEGGNHFDLIVVGAGPAGLTAAVYAASEGLHCCVIECEAIGGQAGSTSLIRNYLGFSRGISGGDLAQRAYQQAWVFGVEFLLMREAVELRPGTERHVIAVPDVGDVSARAVVLATGVSYRRIGIPSLESLAGAGVFYGASISEARALAGERVLVVGGGNSAGQAAINLSRWAGAVTLLVRGSTLAGDMSQYLCDEIDAAPNIDVRLDTEVIGGAGEGRLEAVSIRDRVSGETSTLEAAALFILIGAHPRTEWLPGPLARDSRGYVLTGADVARNAGGEAGWHLDRPPFSFETSVPGVFAVGDVRSGSVKRIAAAVGQGSVVIQQLHELLAHDQAAQATQDVAWR